jgi:hypothetical protein
MGQLIGKDWRQKKLESNQKAPKSQMMMTIMSYLCVFSLILPYIIKSDVKCELKTQSIDQVDRFARFCLVQTFQNGNIYQLTTNYTKRL